MHQFADEFFVGRLGEPDLDDPGTGLPACGVGVELEGAGGGFRRVKRFDDDIGDGASGRFVADKAQNVGGVVGGHSFEHGRG